MLFSKESYNRKGLYAFTSYFANARENAHNRYEFLRVDVLRFPPPTDKHVAFFCDYSCDLLRSCHVLFMSFHRLPVRLFFNFFLKIFF